MTVVTPTNGVREVTVRLAPDSNLNDDELMTRFDNLRAEAHHPEPAKLEDRVSSDRQANLVRLHDEISDIAAELEKRDKPDLASAVYFNLSYLPNVTRVMVDGKPEIVGYSNGYVADDPVRREYQERAIFLNRSNPNMAILKFRIQHGIKGSARGLGKALQLQYSSFLETVIKNQGERVWPITYSHIVYVYGEEEDLDNACMALNRAIHFDPSYSTDNWKGMFYYLNSLDTHDGHAPCLRDES